MDLWLYTGSDGRFSARGLPPGRYRLYCSASAAFREKEVFLDLTEGTAEDDVDIALEPKRCGTLLLRVVTADGRPPHDLSIGVTDTRPSRGNGDSQVASSFGTLRPTQRTECVYEVELDGGLYVIRVYTQSTLRARFEVQIDEGRTSERIVDLR